MSFHLLYWTRRCWCSLVDIRYMYSFHYCTITIYFPDWFAARFQTCAFIEAMVQGGVSLDLGWDEALKVASAVVSPIFRHSAALTGRSAEPG